MYIPPEQPSRGLSIIQEQIRLIRHINTTSSFSSGTAAFSPMIYYTQIGGGDTNTDIQSLCQPCTQLQKLDSGDEVLTLQAMFDYCQDHPTHQVVYLHNKGSKTDEPRNHHLRRVLMLGALSTQCLFGIFHPRTNRNGKVDDKNEKDTCDVCSTQFSPLPIPHTVGNMFVAQCQYVRQLMPPNDFTERKQQVHDLARREFQKPFLYRLYNTTAANKRVLHRQFEKESWSGLGRFAMEQWVYSHPHIRPCDVYDGPEYIYATVDTVVSPTTFFTPKRRQMAPRRLLNSTQSLHPWYLLPGRLYEWKHLYNATPPPTSWVWDYYPST